MHTSLSRSRRAFTLVELMVVIVVIGILAAVTIVAYNQVTNNAIIASIQTDLKNASQQITLYASAHSAQYPTSIDCSSTPAANSICLKSSPGNTFSGLYAINVKGVQSFCVAMTNGNYSYYTDEDRAPQPGICSTVNGIIGWWKFNGNTNDVSGNGNNGTNNGATSTTGQNGQQSGAYAMAGGDIYVGSPAIINNLASTGFTYSIWVNRTGTSSNQWPIIMGGEDTHYFYGIRSQYFGDKDTFEYGLSPYNGSSYAQMPLWSLVSANTWHLATETYSGTTLKWYFDGTLVSTTSDTLNPSNQYFDFGSWTGTIDDARIYNRPLSASEISWLYKMNAQ